MKRAVKPNYRLKLTGRPVTALAKACGESDTDPGRASPRRSLPEALGDKEGSNDDTTNYKMGRVK